MRRTYPMLREGGSSMLRARGGRLLHLLWLLLAAGRGQASTNKLLLVSMDGFRWDYVTADVTPALWLMARTGVKAPYVNNTFVTVSFPNHHSIVTGLYQESHGLVSNYMYDKERRQWFDLTTTDPFWWEGARPLWVKARQAGKGAGVHSWPGAEVVIEGLRPSVYVGYNQYVAYATRVQEVVEWLRPQGLDLDLALLYFDEPDTTGHNFGPESSELTSVLRQMDALMGDLWRRLEAAEMDVNVIITSDHGMTSVDMEKVVFLGDYFDLSLLEVLPLDEVVVGLLPRLGREQEVWDSLQHVAHLQTYWRESLPERFHYKHGKHVLPITVVAEEGWMVTANMSLLEDWNPKGNHGYDNALQSMKPIFLAKGPDFKRNFTLEPIQSVDIYPLACRLLGVTPDPHNGSLARVLPSLHSRVDSGASTAGSALGRLRWLVLLAAAFIQSAA